jgi:hypothetical protein
MLLGSSCRWAWSKPPLNPLQHVPFWLGARWDHETIHRAAPQWINPSVLQVRVDGSMDRCWWDPRAPCCARAAGDWAVGGASRSLDLARNVLCCYTHDLKLWVVIRATLVAQVGIRAGDWVCAVCLLRPPFACSSDIADCSTLLNADCVCLFKNKTKKSRQLEREKLIVLGLFFSKFKSKTTNGVCMHLLVLLATSPCLCVVPVQ